MSTACPLPSFLRNCIAALVILHAAAVAAVASAPGFIAGADPELYAAIVIDAHGGTILHAENADELRHPASLTKVMTLYLLFEQLEAGTIQLDTPLPVSEYAASMERTKLNLVPGETIGVREAILGLVTHSANDAAVVIAEALAGDEGVFAQKMTAKARELGMKNTIYRNASGLPDDEQVTTARDQAVLGWAIQVHFPRYYPYFSTRSFIWRGVTLRNHNHLLGRVEGLDGIKTGYIRSSKFNLVASVRRDDRHIVAVVLGGSTARSRDARMRALITHCIRRAKPRGPIVVAETHATSPEMR